MTSDSFSAEPQPEYLCPSCGMRLSWYEGEFCQRCAQNQEDARGLVVIAVISRGKVKAA